MLCDPVDDPRPHRDGQSVPHAFDDEELGIRNGIGDIDPALDRHQRVGVAMDHQGRNADRFEQLLVAPRRKNCCELPGDAGWIQTAGVDLPGALGIAGLVQRGARTARTIKSELVNIRRSAGSPA